MIGRDQEWLEWWASVHLPGAQDRARFLGLDQTADSAAASPGGGSAAGRVSRSDRRVDKSHPRRMLVVGTRAD
jgi:hypothetical protein